MPFLFIQTSNFFSFLTLCSYLERDKAHFSCGQKRDEAWLAAAAAAAAAMLGRLIRSCLHLRAVSRQKTGTVKVFTPGFVVSRHCGCVLESPTQPPQHPPPPLASLCLRPPSLSRSHNRADLTYGNHKAPR